MVRKVLVCDDCKKINPTWHYANTLNSSKFCDICRTYCSFKNLTEEEIKYYEEQHEQYMSKKKGRKI